MENDLLECIKNFSARCLNKATEWASDLLMAITKDKTAALEYGVPVEKLTVDQHARLSMARALYAVGEYQRGAFFLEKTETKVGQFLHFYLQFMELQKHEWEDCAKNIENAMFRTPSATNNYQMLLNRLLKTPSPDSYLKYLTACLYLRLKDETAAIYNLIKAVNADPLNWPAWKELAQLTNLENLEEISREVPRVWVRDFYSLEVEKRIGFVAAHTHCWENFSNLGLIDSIYLRSTIALKLKALNLVDRAQTAFEEVISVDPYNLEIIDTYSNILYLKQDVMKLSILVQHTLRHARYRAETCYVTGNLYNAANLHNEAATYFKQALLLNPQYTAAWTLLGHEFIETKNVASAMAAYKRAVDLDPLEYRAWFGLAQVYELMKMPLQALPLFKKAYCLRPSDSKLSLAVARVYEALGRRQECIDMLDVSVESGDPEGLSTAKLAGLLEASEPDRAATLYQRFLAIYDDKGMALAEDSAVATCFLMDYCFERHRFDDAEAYARRGCRYSQALKHAELTLQKLDKLMAQGVLKRKSRPLVPTRKLMLDEQDNSQDNHSDMDLATSP